MHRLDTEPFTTITPIPTRNSVALALLSNGGGAKPFDVARPSLGLDNYMYYCGYTCIGRIKVGSDTVDDSFVVNGFDLLANPSEIVTGPTGDVFTVGVASSDGPNWIVKLPFGESTNPQKIMLPDTPGNQFFPRASIAASPFMQIEHDGEQRYGFYLVVTVPDGLLRVDFDVNGNQLGTPYKIQGSDTIPLLAPTDVCVSPQGDVFAPDASRNSVIWLLSGRADRVSEIACPGNPSFVSNTSAITGDRDYLYMWSGDANSSSLIRFGNPQRRAPYPTVISAAQQPNGLWGSVAMGDSGQFCCAAGDTLTLLSDAGHSRAQTLTLEEAGQITQQSGYAQWSGVVSVPGPDVSTKQRSWYGSPGQYSLVSLLWMR
jgi:hypothetical protein